VDWAGTTRNLTRLSGTDLFKLLVRVRKELTVRKVAAEALNEQLDVAYWRLANFMAGVTWALMCRVALRGWRGHYPTGGTRPQSGAPWLPWETMAAHQRALHLAGWDPIMAPSWTYVRDHLLEHMERHPCP